MEPWFTTTPMWWLCRIKHGRLLAAAWGPSGVKLSGYETAAVHAASKGHLPVTRQQDSRNCWFNLVPHPMVQIVSTIQNVNECPKHEEPKVVCCPPVLPLFLEFQVWDMSRALTFYQHKLIQFSNTSPKLWSISTIQLKIIMFITCFIIYNTFVYISCCSC